MTPHQQETLRTSLRAAIAIGHAASVTHFLTQSPQAPASLLGEMLHDVLDASSFVVVRNFRNHGGNVNSQLIPKFAADYETGLTRIARTLISHGADLNTQDEMGNTPAQRCFDNANDDRGYPRNSATRWYTCLEIVRSTLKQDPEWKPDYERLFTSLFYKPEDKDAKKHRGDIARWANTMGYYTNKWIETDTPVAASLRLCMSAESRAFWSRNKGMHWDPDLMPWMDHKNLKGEDLQRALGNSGLTFAFGTSQADAAIAKAKTGGKLPPPAAA